MNATGREKAKAKVHTVRVGNIGVKVYTRHRGTATGKRTVYEVVDYATGRRVLRGFDLIPTGFRSGPGLLLR